MDGQAQRKTYTYFRSTFYHNGKQYSATGKTQREADRKADAKRLAMKRGEVTTGGDMTVLKWTEEWLETHKAPSIGEGQYINYKSYIKTINDAIGQKRLCDVTPVDLQLVLNRVQGKSKSYALHLKHTIKAIFWRACISRMIRYDPAQALNIPNALDNSRRSLTPDERTAILGIAEVHHAGLWVLTMLYCGLRPAETRALDWRHIDLDNKVLHVEQSIKAKTMILGPPKTKAGVRSVPIPLPLLAAFAAARGEPDEPVFKQPTTGRRHTASSLTCLWNNFKRELDISLGAKVYRNQIVESKIAPDLVAYCLRHTYGTDLQSAGVPLNVAKYLMGHSDIAVTANVYTHTQQDDNSLADAAALISAFHTPAT
jgi:integrase